MIQKFLRLIRNVSLHRVNKQLYYIYELSKDLKISSKFKEHKTFLFFPKVKKLLNTFGFFKQYTRVTKQFLATKKKLSISHMLWTPAEKSIWVYKLLLVWFNKYQIPKNSTILYFYIIWNIYIILYTLSLPALGRWWGVIYV